MSPWAIPASWIEWTSLETTSFVAIAKSQITLSVLKLWKVGPRILEDIWLSLMRILPTTT
jgi:hypothetical protein